jgi:outer membrane protein insertion porin family
VGRDTLHMPAMITLFLLTVFTTPDSAPELVREIVVEGLVAVGREVALEGIETEVGQPVDPETLTRDIKVLWDQQLFSDVRVDREHVDGGWRVVFTVTERPLLRSIVFGGNDGRDDDALLREIESATFRAPVTDAAARADADRLIEFYRKNGWTRAEVVARIEPVPTEPGQADLLFDIREGPRARIVSLAIDGNEEVPDEVILDALQTCEVSLVNRFLRGCWFDEDALQTDLFRVQALYYELGYVVVKVDVPTIDYSDDGEEVSIHIPVEEGGQYRIGRIQFAIQGLPPVFPIEKLRRLLGIEDNDVFNRTRLFRGIERIQTAYRYEIQTIVAVTPESELDMEDRLVHLTFTIEPPEPRPTTAPGLLLPQPINPL